MFEGIVEIPLSGQPLTLEPRVVSDQPTRLALGRFVAGPENALAPVAVQSVLDPVAAAYSPLVLYGPPGSGKSHLALGLAAAWKALYPRRLAIATTAVDFARELAEAIETKTTDDFGGRYRQASLLVLDDVQHLGGKEPAQQELIHILDRLSDAGAQVVLTARAAPALLSDLLPTLQSRLMAGLAVPLVLPGRETRRIILQRLAAERSLQVGEDVLDLLSEQLEGTVPELAAALGHLVLAARTQRGAIDTASVRRYLVERTRAQQPSLRDIALLTARHFSMKLTELRSSTRRRGVVTARGVAMYLARTLTNSSLDEIGRYFGGRDHTTVAHGCRKTEELLATEPAIRMAIEQLQAQL